MSPLLPTKVLGVAFWAALAIVARAETGEPVKESRFAQLFDPDDGCFDLSKELDHPMGFIPLVIPITEPAVGAGAAVAPIFINLPEDHKGRPDIWGVGAMYTSNGSEGILGGWSAHWLDGRLQTLVGLMDASINLDFHGLGRDTELGGAPLQYNTEFIGGGGAVKWKLDPERRWDVGINYRYADVTVSFPDINSRNRALADPTGRQYGFNKGLLRTFQGFDSTIGSLGFTIGYDTRDNLFTPTSGIYSELGVTFNDAAFGGSSTFQLFDWTGLWFTPVFSKDLILGLRGDFHSSAGDIPFYYRPSIDLRGTPKGRYQGEHVAYTEAELRWQFDPRWSVLAFGGTGAAWSDGTRFAQTEVTYTGGVGVRYLLARRYGLHMGIDVAFGEEGPACYIQFGNAWFRP
ncbi:MAG: BamA/TamA family outer membrane protein [Luteolibacter sp.]